MANPFRGTTKNKIGSREELLSDDRTKSPVDIYIVKKHPRSNFNPRDNPHSISFLVVRYLVDFLRPLGFSWSLSVTYLRPEYKPIILFEVGSDAFSGHGIRY
jgi:hypothetical protein